MADACSFLQWAGEGIQMEHQDPFYFLQLRIKVHMKKNDPSHPSSVSWLFIRIKVHQVTEADYIYSNPRNLSFLFKKRPINYSERCQVFWRSPAIKQVNELHDSLKSLQNRMGMYLKAVYFGVNILPTLQN